MRGLNDAQRQAVTTIDGPVLVVAGPGTGKTQLLSLRVAEIIHRTDTDAGSILCLTFTNAAATNMRQRLTDLVGPSARTVTVRTFHSFAAEIMDLYPDYFWNGAQLSVAPDALQLQIIQTILSELPLDNPLAMKFAGAYTAVSDVQSALKLTREAGLSPSKLQAILAANESYLDVIEPQLCKILDGRLSFKNLGALAKRVAALQEQAIDASVAPLTSLSAVINSSLATAIAADELIGKTTNTSKWKRRWISKVGTDTGMLDERRRLAWWQALIPAYEQYRELLQSRGYYDYSDMIVEVITQLESHPELLALVQERFLYVLIDEFQDTNKAQLRLANLVAANPATEGKPNLMAVGDDDQSIFAFNGAELSNMLSFTKSYPSTRIIVLQDNYRSSQLVLDTAGKVIEQASERLVHREPGLTKQLTARREPALTAVTHIAYPTREQQLSGIARRVQDDYKANPDSTMAVLARGHKSLEQLSSLLGELNVPVRYERQRDVFGNEVVQLLMLLAETVEVIGEGDEPKTNQHLARLLQHPIWNIEPKTLWQLAIRQRNQADWLQALLDHHDEQLVNIAKWLLWLAGEASYQPLPILLELLIGLRPGQHLTSPVREHYLISKTIDHTYLEGLSAVKLLQTMADEFTHQPLATLYDLTRFYRLNTSLGRTISDSSWFVSGDRAVELMTIHKAKGLEFDNVYIIDAVDSTWSPRTTGRKPPANLPLQQVGEIFDDYARMMYVAITRARQSVLITSYTNDDKNEAVLPTPLLADVPAQHDTLDDTSLITVLEQSLQWPRLSGGTERQLLQPVLENFRLSASGLLQFLNVSTAGPQIFLEQSLLRVPETQSAVASYGTAVHRALQFAQMQQPKPDLDAILGAYQQALRQQRLTDTDFNRYLAHGELVLQKLFIEHAFVLPPNGQAEVSCNDLRIGDAIVGGKIDHLVIDDGTLLITDYKTGTPMTSFTTRDQNKAIKAWKHRTQLTYYAMLCQLSGRYKYDNLETRILYVEAEEPRALSLTFTPTQEDITRLQAIIEAVWPKIISLNLPDITNYSNDMKGISAFEDDLLSGAI